MCKKFLAVAVPLFFLAVSFAAGSSSWSINDVDGPRSPENVTNGSQTLQLIELTDGSGDPVDETTLDSQDWALEYNYSGTIDFMEHLEGGYYYANFTADNSSTDIEYQLTENVGDGEINTTETLHFKNLTVDIQTRLSSMKADTKEFFEVNLTDQNTGTSGDEGKVFITITNGSEYRETELGWNNGLFTQDVTVPEYYNEDVLVHGYAVSTDSPAKTGSESYLSEIYPESTGHVAYLNTSSGCNNNSFFDSCERGAKIETGFNATPFSASDVDLHVNKVEDGGTVEEVEEIQMEKYDGLWNGNVTLPDINTSEYQKKVFMQYNATIDGTTFIQDRNISYESYTIRDRSAATAYQGTDYQVEFLFGRYHSLSSLNSTRIEEANITMYEEDGDQFESFSLSDMSYNTDTGLFENTIEIPSDASLGIYDTEIEANNTYKESKSRSSSFAVEAIDASFNTSSDFEYDYASTGSKDETFEITNRLNEPIAVDANFSSDLENISTFNDNESLDLGDSETDNATLSFDVFTVEDIDGEMTLTENTSDYSKTFDVDIDSPDCEMVNGSLCIDRTDEWINLTATNTSSLTRTVTVDYLGETSSFVSTNITGEVSEYLTIDPSSDTVFDQLDFELNYTPQTIGTYNGDIVFEGSENSLTLKTSFESEVQNLQPSITSDSLLDLSSAVKGTEFEARVIISNDGNADVNSLSASSDTFDVDIDSTSIPAGEDRTTNVTISDIQSSTGSIDITGSTDDGSTTTTVSTTGSIIDYETRISDLEETVSDLQEDAESQETVDELSSISVEISELETLYQEGRTQEANEKFNTVQADLSDIEFEIQQNSQPATPPGESPGQSPGDDTEEVDEPEEGGSPLVIIAVVLFVLLIIGFVVYTSYIPEPGDPLYEYLGEG